MRTEYYKFISEHSLINGLKEIIWPYSSKLKVLQELSKRFSSKEINLALMAYKENYIDKNIVNMNTIKNVLIGLCNKEKQNDSSR